VRYDINIFPPFAGPDVNSDGPANGLSRRQLAIGQINFSSSMNFGQNQFKLGRKNKYFDIAQNFVEIERRENGVVVVATY